MPESDQILSVAERARIREELRYVQAVVQENRPTAKTTLWDKTLAFISNGFVLLLAGSLITSYVVPQFQREYESKKQRLSLMQDCLSQFLLYSNSMWQEYYSFFPLLHESEISKADYDRYINTISEIKLRRYDAYAKMEANAIVFRVVPDRRSDVEDAMYEYAVSVNEISGAIDTWLRKLYESSDPISPMDFDPREEFNQIKALVMKMENSTESVSELMVRAVKSPDEAISAWRMLRIPIFLLLFLLLLIPVAIYANGHSVGVRRGDLPVNAECIDISGVSHKLKKVQITGGDTKGSFLNAKVGEAKTAIPMGRITKLSVKSTETDAEGFAAVSVTSEDGSETDYKVQLKEKGEPIRLKGLDGNGSVVSIDILKCKTISFSIPEVGEKETKGTMKK